ncbi:RES family NAD+ phosphorylase [Roseivirga sp.]|uniref:RES family NAD+ phosphorylase n=1 Tax=Roseivirga sp. TaxID=1964215 RepID=UPI003B515E76
MLAYRICKEEYSTELKASGRINRWNKEGEFVIYAAESRALCALELLAHTNGVTPQGNYKVMVIDISEPTIEEVSMDALPSNWKSIKSYPALQRIGSHWYHKQSSLILKVPSVLVAQEYNYVINVKHSHFNQLKIAALETFFWDERL